MGTGTSRLDGVHRSWHPCGRGNSSWSCHQESRPSPSVWSRPATRQGRPTSPEHKRPSLYKLARVLYLLPHLVCLSQLYGSTTVVMAIYGLHWKWRSLTPCHRHPSEEPIEKIFGTIDYVIDLDNLAKFGLGKIFRDWGTYTQHIRFCAFFSFSFFFIFLTFYALWHGYSLNGWTDFDAQFLKRRRLVRGGAFSMIEKNRLLDLDL